MQLGNLYESLDNITRIQVTDSLDELVQSLIILALFIEVVCVFFADLCYNFLREIGILSYFLCLTEETFLQKSLDFHIVLHLVQFV